MLDDIGADGGRQVVGLTGQVSGNMVVDTVFLECRIAQIGPQHGDQAQLMGPLKGRRDLFYLTTRLFRAEIDRRAHGHRPHIERLLNAGVEGLVVLGGVAQRFVMVELHQERNTMRVTARHRGQHAVGRRHAVTAGFDRQLDDILRIKVQRVGGEGGPRRVLHALVDRQNGQVAGPPQSSGVVQGLHIA